MIGRLFNMLFSLTLSDKNLPALPSIIDGDKAVPSGISTTPFSDGMVHVFVNGLAVSVGDGTLTRDCYFSSPSSPLTPKLIANISAGDTLRWNPTVAGYQLSSSDSISLLYQ